MASLLHRGMTMPASAGFGVALLPTFLGDADTCLKRLSVAAQPPARPLWMSVHADVRRSPLVRAVMDHLVSLFDDPAP